VDLGRAVAALAREGLTKVGATRGRYAYDWPRPMVTVDAVVFRRAGTRLEVLLVRRGHPPFEGQAAFPGGFVDEDEDLRDAAARELREETGLAGVRLEQLGAYGKPGRDPRGHNVSVVFVGQARGRAKVRGGDDAAEAFWAPARRPLPLAFDHAEILAEAVRVYGKWL
jgi:8-oxo-dGTP diphosphatase